MSDILRGALSGLRRDALRAKSTRDPSKRPGLMISIGLGEEEGPIEEAAESPEMEAEENSAEGEMSPEELALLEEDEEEEL